MSSPDQENTFREIERPFINGDRPILPIPQRHGFVTGWLKFMMIGGSAGILIYLFAASKIMEILKISSIVFVALIILLILKLVFTIMLFRWNKNGFYGLFATTVIGFIINSQIGVKPLVCMASFVGIGILYAILQIKKGGRSTWYYLK